MTNALSAVAQSMQNDLRYMETVSQNMVNIATPGYKRAIPAAQVFGEAMQAAGQAALDGADAPRLAQATPALFDLSAGAVKQTGKPFDLAITGDGFFELATPEGAAYTRAGDFHLDARSRLVSALGYPVQGLQGDIVVGGNGGGVSIDHAGQVLQDGVVVARLKLMRFAGPRDAVKNGAGLLQAAPGAAAMAEAQPELQVGALESSNVAPMREMVAMMETTRHFEATQKLYQGYDDIIGSAIQKLGQF
jgi:flagellar basal-body rod protein FlgF